MTFIDLSSRNTYKKSDVTEHVFFFIIISD